MNLNQLTFHSDAGPSAGSRRRPIQPAQVTVSHHQKSAPGVLHERDGSNIGPEKYQTAKEGSRQLRSGSYINSRKAFSVHYIHAEFVQKGATYLNHNANAKKATQSAISVSSAF